MLESTDVNHAFYVPQFLIKRDLIPVGENGTPNELEFTITEAGHVRRASAPSSAAPPTPT